jgi:hypothetical protein
MCGLEIIVSGPPGRECPNMRRISVEYVVTGTDIDPPPSSGLSSSETKYGDGRHDLDEVKITTSYRLVPAAAPGSSARSNG